MHAQVSWSPALGSDGKPEPDLRIFVFITPEDSTLRVRLINPASSWRRAGLHTGDRLVSLDGQPVATSTDFRSWLGKIQIGDTARLVVARDGTTGATSDVTVVVTGYDRPAVTIGEVADATVEQRRLRAQWLSALP